MAAKAEPLCKLGLRPGQPPDGIEAQTRAVMENLGLVLAGLDLGFEQVVMARIYLTHIKGDYAAMKRDLSQLLPARPPAGPHLRRRRPCL